MALSLRVRSALFFFLPFGIVSIILFLGFLTASISKTTDLTSKIQTSMPSPLASPSATVTTQPSTTEVLGRATATTNEQLLAIEKLFLLINAHRDEHHIPKVRLHPKLIASAQLKLNDMISKGYYQHEDENKQTTWEFIQLAGYHYSIAGENLAFNIGSEWDIFTAWKESETHNKEMLHPLYRCGNCNRLRQHRGPRIQMHCCSSLWERVAKIGYSVTCFCKFLYHLSSNF